jgi:penicillin-binding protein 1A
MSARSRKPSSPSASNRPIPRTGFSSFISTRSSSASNSYGIAGAALTYFNKSVNELTIAETAYLAALPKAPNNYHPFRNTEAAIERRNWVIDRMVENGYVTADDGAEAKAQPMVVTPRKTGSYLFASEYFAEEVRRELIDRYGNDALLRRRPFRPDDA